MRAIGLLSGFAALLAPLLAHAGLLADIELYDRTAHRVLAIHEHQGRLYVAGEPQHQYEVRIRSRSGARMLAVTSVDGVNVISGKTAAEHQGGYVLDAWSSVAIDGWRKSLDEVATFYFTRLSDSYAARTGRPHDVGVIGVALFPEQQRCCSPWREEPELDDRVAPAPSTQAEHSASAPYAQRRSDSQLGTGHGRREASPAEYVEFQRASSTPEETIVIYYDSRRNLLARGVLPDNARLAERRPNPFPEGFVADP